MSSVTFQRPENVTIVKNVVICAQSYVQNLKEQILKTIMFKLKERLN